MAKATQKTYELLTELFVSRDIEVEGKDIYLLDSLSIDHDQFKSYVEHSKKRDKERRAMWLKIIKDDDSTLGA
mgnify:FL=1